MRSRCVGVALLLCSELALAQFKWVDAAGRVGYGDKPPPGAHDVEPLGGIAKGTPADPLNRLPYSLQQTVQDFPVTLYTTDSCPACDSGRTLLKGRAVPFAERLVRTSRDVAELSRLTGSERLPVLQVGKQTLTSFNSATWEAALELAGYPRENQLPAQWTWPAPQPLTEDKRDDKPAPTAQEQQ